MILTEVQRAKYRLRHGKCYTAYCDTCGKLIEGLYEVLEWSRRPDKLTFLGAIPTAIRCLSCTGVYNGDIKMVDYLPVVQKSKDGKDVPYFLAKAIKSMLKRAEEGLNDDEIIAKLSRKKDLKQCKKGVVRKTVRELKKLDLVRRSRGKWWIKEKKARKR